MRVPKLLIPFLFISALYVNHLGAQNIELQYLGKNPYETSFLDSIFNRVTHRDFDSLKKELDSSLNKLQTDGFIESTLIDLQKESDSLFIATIHLNNKYDDIVIYYDSDQIEGNLLNTKSANVTSEYFVIPISNIQEVINFLNKKSSEKGKPFISFQLTNITKRNETELQGNLKIKSPDNRKIDNIVIKGYEKFPESFIKRFLKIRPSQELNITSIENKTSSLGNISFASQIKEPEILFTKDSTTVYLYLKKNKSSTFDGFLGFGNNENTNRLEFDGYLNLNLVNNLNYGESFRLLYKSDENEQRTFNVSAEMPYVLNSPVGVNLNLNIFKKDSTFSVVSQSAKLFYNINSKNTIYGGIEYIRSDNLIEQNPNSTLIEDYKSNFLTSSYEHVVRTASFLFPIQTYFFLEGGLGKREIQNITEEQTAVKFRAFNLFTFNERNSIYINVNGDFLFSDEYYTNELRRFGGINSIRGFEENSIFASLYSVLNSEYRYSLNKNIYIHSIIDAAYYENDIGSIKEKLFGFGFGLGVATKSGLLRLNYANGLSEDQPFKFSNSKIHISLNAFF